MNKILTLLVVIVTILFFGSCKRKCVCVDNVTDEVTTYKAKSWNPISGSSYAYEDCQDRTVSHYNYDTGVNEGQVCNLQ